MADPEHNRRIARYRDFWPFYLSEHRNVTSRRLHFLGTGLSIAAVLAALLVNPLWAVAIPLGGYGCAWFGHFVFEKNQPATFRYPFWSLVSDYRMFFLWLSGRLGPELRKAGVAA